MLSLVHSPLLLLNSERFRQGPYLNHMEYKSTSLHPVTMWCCGPRRGVQACPLGARTVGPDSHVATGEETILIMLLTIIIKYPISIRNIFQDYKVPLLKVTILKLRFYYIV